ncbi:bifunctional methylenetetrahydrofolate dehydrogenase/methenyltetrahydrofolate cyclohydrolase FolD [Virgibacillus soli]|uniref:Bifunctional protein FolD n=1 Tax=Paracerasibacillus soli TaxID=480284 RepID=A0ABU5CPY4_9BACI|nr:bifunctional methylenetetrahydrofolate dehydrogenase/methenyltetrahydrofolate cyclohydrolase FolD [Virgibacillus soli]MDY0408399.1 bifunctional methylenetetrahydrofolate dehydrogenase/methenyltetrahydrofolate cyclohydrolase FolD [Virgibacillus soli]
MSTIISGKKLSRDMREEMKLEIDQLRKIGIKPHLTVIIVGDDPASESYVRGKEKACDEIGMDSTIHKLPSSTSEKELLIEINKLNEDSSVHGILVQLPLPAHIHEQKVIASIHPDKDVDGFHPTNVGKMLTGQDTFLPCTPYGIITMLRSINVELEGKHAVVIGRSNIVGKPVGQLLLNEDATVTYCHSKTTNLQQYTKTADILIVAVGRPHVVNADHIKKGAVVIDVGVNRLENGSLTGDVNFEQVKDVASYITPVPGGVGPMTITMLLKNTIKAAKGLATS